jgi:hypothetical protein
MSITSGTLVVGDSGSGKSSLLATLAEWLWEKYKKVSLLYSTDGGGFPTKMDALIRAGIVRAWKLRTRGEAFETCSRACQGYWPLQFTNPLAGEVPYGVSLIPSSRTTFILHCGKCNATIDVQRNRRAFKNLYECKCGNRVTLRNAIVEDKTETSTFFEEVGGCFYDGITSMNDWVMEDLADKHGRGEIGGEESNLGGKVKSGDMIFGGSNRSHYGFAQIRSMVWLQDANNIKGLTIGPVFTARTQRAVDTNSNVRIYGPQIAGQAKTADVPAWIGNCLGADVKIDNKGRKEWVLHLTEYQEPGDDAIHLCKTRAAPGMLPDTLTDGPVDTETGRPVSGVATFSQFNLGHFMDLLEEATKKTYDETKKAFPDTPGLKYLELMKEEAKKEKEKQKQQAQETEAKPQPQGPPRPGGPKPNTPTMTNRPAQPKPNAGPIKRGPGRPPKNPAPRPGK